MHEAERVHFKLNQKMENMDYNMCDYHSAKLADMSSRRINGGTAVGIAFGAAAILGVGLVALYGNARAKSAENLIASQQSSNQNYNNLVATYAAAERLERVTAESGINNFLLRQSCPVKVEQWSCQPCPCPAPACGTCGR